MSDEMYVRAILTHRPIVAWPGELTRNRKSSPFSATWSQTLLLLDRELTHLGARSPVVLQVAVDEKEIRLDGQVRADARPSHPGVILSVESRKLGTVTFPCDAFTHWQANVRAIALGLEALRKVDRYGITRRGEQYTGWKALPSGIALGATTMTIEEAARFVASHTDADWSQEIEDDPSFAIALYKDAAKLLHPDQGGDPALFRQLTQARDLLVAHFGPLR